MIKIKKQKIVVLVFGVIMMIYFSLFLQGKKGNGSKKYNFVIIVSDALRQDVLGCYGGDAETPNIDWLAENGVVFENAYSTAPCTLPSSVTMLTGNFSKTYGIVRKMEPKLGWGDYEFCFYVPNEEKLLPEALKESGYEAKMDIENVVANKSNSLQGFEKLRTLKQMSPGEVKRVETATGIRNIGFNEDFEASSNYNRMYGLLYYLLTVPKDQPFFIIKWIMDPHIPYNPPEKFRKRIPVDTATLPKEINFYTMMKNYLWRLKKKERAFLKHLYDAEVESVDERVGFVIKVLKQRGFLKNTIIVFTSDHGEAFGEHKRWVHGDAFYEQLVKIPLIFSGPGIPKGKREKTVISHLDLMPTLKDLTNQEYKENMGGESYGPLFSGKKIKDRIVYFDQITNELKDKRVSDGLLMDWYKLILEDNPQINTRSLMLYNLSKDPSETKDLSKIERGIMKKMFSKRLSIRKKNQKKLKKNLAKIGKDVDLESRSKETLKALKTLGYINGGGKIPAPEPTIPADVKVIESKARKIYKNNKGFWEADYGDGIIMVYIPPGKFTMGQTNEEKNWLMEQFDEKTYNESFEDETPLHPVYLDGYWIGKTEVTVKQFNLFVKDTGYVTEAESSGGAYTWTGEEWERDKKEGINWKNPGFKQEDNHPVVCVSWNDAVKYCKWFSSKTGLNFKLPKEARWEKAARWTDSRKYPWGGHEPYYNGQWYANYAASIDKRAEDGFAFTAPVGSYPQGASSYGVLDIVGNVWEWCSDWYKSDYYKDSPKENPKGPNRGTQRVLRGGGWGGDGAQVMRCADRGMGRPTDRCSGLGFRLCQDKRTTSSDRPW